MFEELQGKAPAFSVRWAGFVNKLYRYRRLLWKRWWIPLLTLSLGLGIAAWWASTRPPVFSSSARMMVSGKFSMPEGGVGYSEEASNFFGTQVELMQSGEVRRRAQEQVVSGHPEVEPSPVKLDVSQLRGASIFTLKATGGSPKFTQAFLDACMDEYIESKKEMRSNKTDVTVSAITEELARLEKELQGGEEELLAFQKANNIGYLEQEGNSAATYLEGLNRQLADLRKEFDLLALLDLDQNLDRVQTKGDAQGGGSGVRDPIISGFGPESEYMKAKEKVEVLKAQREDFARVLRPAHPTMVQLDEDIGNLERLIVIFRGQSVEQLKTRRDSMALQIQSLEKVVKEWEDKATDSGVRLAEYNRIKVKLDRAKALYERLLTSLRSVDVTKRIDQDSVSILERASPPVSVRPGLLLMALAGMGAGAAVGLLILFWMDLLDDRMTSFTELQAHFTDRVLAQIPLEKHQGNLSPLADHDPRHAFAESFRSLRSSIFYLPIKEGKAPKTLLVTSSVPNEGKSTVSTNLAITMALASSNVLLIDTDVRRGSLHTVFGVQNERGLGEVLRGEATAADCVQATAVPNLSILTRGGSLDHPSELFLGKGMDQLLREVYESYDYIVLDTAPVMVADDTASLAPKIDACLYVIRFSHSSSRVSLKGLDLLKSRQANVLGIVCNEVHDSMPEYYYYYQYSEYYGAKAKAEARA